MDELEQLLQKKDELEKLIRSKQENLQLSRYEASSELSMYDQHHADIATDLYEREKDVSMLEMLGYELEKVEDALGKYRSGHYGICERCGRPIEPSRQKAVPGTVLCAKCAHLQDSDPHDPLKQH